MTDQEKIYMIKILLSNGETDAELPSDETLSVYLQLAQAEILSWKYHLIGGVPTDVTTINAAEETEQIYAVVAGYTHAGAEGEQLHIENGVHRHYIYGDMIDYIHNHILPYVRVGAIT